LGYLFAPMGVTPMPFWTCEQCGAQFPDSAAPPAARSPFHIELVIIAHSLKTTRNVMIGKQAGGATNIHPKAGIGITYNLFEKSLATRNKAACHFDQKAV
jgi:hypothetical protein